MSSHMLSSLFVPTVCILPDLLVWHVTLIIIGIFALMVAIVMTIWIMITCYRNGGESIRRYPKLSTTLYSLVYIKLICKRFPTRILN